MRSSRHSKGNVRTRFRSVDTTNLTYSSINKKNKQSKKLNKKPFLIALLIIIIALLVVLGIKGCSSNDSKTSTTINSKTQTATIGNGGDIIIHQPFYNSNYEKDGDYDFTECFSKIKSTWQKSDFFVINLETTLAGKDKGYQGYPTFNSPDTLPASLKSSGVDLFLLANNHIYDNGKDGFLRTSTYLSENDYNYTGAYHDGKEKRYFTKTINGIKVGFVNFTYETTKGISGNKTINSITMASDVAGYLNSFNVNDLDSFYSNVQTILDDMKKDGVEFTIFYPHWGEEYQLTENSLQDEIAQKLCDMGIDAIIGGHPHVVQPIDVLTSSDKDSNHKTFCAYSLGNQISNQRAAYMGLGMSNTEDGLIVNLEITKKDNKVTLSNVTYIPTWVYKPSNAFTYTIIPLDDMDSIDSNMKSDCENSYDRTMKIISSGIEKVKRAYNFK